MRLSPVASELYPDRSRQSPCNPVRDVPAETCRVNPEEDTVHRFHLVQAGPCHAAGHIGKTLVVFQVGDGDLYQPLDEKAGT